MEGPSNSDHADESLRHYGLEQVQAVVAALQHELQQTKSKYDALLAKYQDLVNDSLLNSTINVF